MRQSLRASRGQIPPSRQKSPRDYHHESASCDATDNTGFEEEVNCEALTERLAGSGFQASMLTECMGQGGIDLLFDALKNYHTGSLDRAELLGVLLVLVSHGGPQYLGRAKELLVELRRTL